MENRARTLFVRNLPYTATNETLESKFSDIGPVQKCFVISDKEGTGCRGFGYVTYAMREDAETAIKKVQTMDSRKLSITFANRKVKVKKNAKTQDSDQNKADGGETVTGERVMNKEKAMRIAQLTLAVSGFKDSVTYDDVTALFGQGKKVIKVEYPAPNTTTPTALARFKCRRDAVKAMNRIKKDKNAKLTVNLQSQELRKVSLAPSKAKKSRLIVRNLSFKADTEALRKEFSSHGEIVDVQIPTKPDGKMFGYGFVQFSKITEAAAAIKSLNTKPILGRPVAVDWAISKDKYQEKKSDDAEASSDADSDTDDSGSHSSSETEKKTKKKVKKVEDKIETMSKKEKKKLAKKEKKKNKKALKSENDEATAKKKKKKKSEESEKKKKEGEKKGKKRKPADIDEEDDDEMDEAHFEDGDSAFEDLGGSDDDDEDEEMEERECDIHEGKTLFIRNLSYDTAEDEINKVFKQYGKVVMCRLVINPDTEHSKGMAFVKFQNKEETEKCLAATAESAEDGGLVVDGRRLIVLPAITREQAQELHDKKKAKKKEKPDMRNLHLAREGMIRAGTQSAQGLSPADLQRRSKNDATKRQKLRNPNIFISTTRLSFHNLPLSLDDLKLRRLILKTVNEKMAKITECRIMRDLQNMNTKGVAKSRGYAFVNFTEHKHALQTLRKMNNSPDIFPDKRRLIVEFSLENKAALDSKKQRMERQERKRDVMTKKDKNADGTYNSRRPSKKRKLDQPAGVGLEDLDGDVKRPKGMKALPSHWGPKVRHKKRPAPKAPKKPKEGKSRSQKQQEKQEVTERQDSKKSKREKKGGKKRRGEDDNFERMVNKYKQKLTSAMGGKGEKKGKWYAG